MNKINIGIFGCVSVGKSTFINAIYEKQYSTTEIKKTTMIPQIYEEGEEEEEGIKEKNDKMNKKILKKIENNELKIEDCIPINHKVKVCDLFNLEKFKDFKINIYDIPGLNDSISKDIYFKWVKENINIFNIIIFITDITKGLNNFDEIEVINLLLDGIKTYNINMVCLMNKCDDIYYDVEQCDLIFNEIDQQNIYVESNNTLIKLIKEYGIENNYITPFLPISAENYYICTLLKNSNKLDNNHKNKLCKNECGINKWKKMTNEEKELLINDIIKNINITLNQKILDTGYLSVKSIIQNIIIDNEQRYKMNYYENIIKKLTDTSIENINDYIDILKEVDYNETIKNIIDNSINEYINKIEKTKKIINLKEFEEIYIKIQEYLINIELIKETINYPKEINKKIINKLKNIIDQVINIDDKVLFYPNNILNYISIINKYIPEEKEKYLKIFLKKYTKIILEEGIIESKDLLNLLKFKNNEMIIIKILINNQRYLQNKHPEIYIIYLIKMKKIIKKMLKTKFTILDIFIEMINKNISIYLDNNALLYNDINYNKVFNAINNKDVNINMKIEKELLKLFNRNNFS